MNKQKPEILLLDVMNTLVVDPFPDTFLDFFDMTMDEFMDKKDVSSWPDFECNRISEDEFFGGFFNSKRKMRGELLKKNSNMITAGLLGLKNF